MAETYSLAIDGTRADATLGTAAQNNVLVGDSGANARSAPGAMAQNTQILCKGPDGQQYWATYDAERSDIGRGIRILKRVAP